MASTRPRRAVALTSSPPFLALASPSHRRRPRRASVSHRLASASHRIRMSSPGPRPVLASFSPRPRLGLPSARFSLASRRLAYPRPHHASASPQPSLIISSHSFASSRLASPPTSPRPASLRFVSPRLALSSLPSLLCHTLNGFPSARLALVLPQHRTGLALA